MSNVTPLPATKQKCEVDVFPLSAYSYLRMRTKRNNGLMGKADSPVSSKIGAIDLTDDYVQKSLTEGWVWGTITFGSYVMPAYGVPGEQGGSNDLSVEERWHVVNYLKNGLTKEAGTAVAAK